MPHENAAREAARDDRDTYLVHHDHAWEGAPEGESDLDRERERRLRSARHQLTERERRERFPIG